MGIILCVIFISIKTIYEGVYTQDHIFPPQLNIFLTKRYSWQEISDIFRSPLYEQANFWLHANSKCIVFHNSTKLMINFGIVWIIYLVHSKHANWIRRAEFLNSWVLKWSKITIKNGKMGGVNIARWSRAGLIEIFEI